MADQRDLDRSNDTKLLTPLVLMGLIIVGGVMFMFMFMGQAPGS